MAIDLGGREIPVVRGLQGLVSKILAGAGGKEFRGGNIAGGVDVELDGYADGAPNGGERPRRDFGQDLIEHFALSDGTRGGLGGGLEARRIGDAGESSGSGRGGRGTRRARLRCRRIARFLRRRLPRSLRGALRRRRCRIQRRTRGLLRGFGNVLRVGGRRGGLCGGLRLRRDGSGLLDGSATMEETRTEEDGGEREGEDDAERKVIEFGQRRQQGRALEVGLNELVARLDGRAPGRNSLRVDGRPCSRGRN